MQNKPVKLKTLLIINLLLLGGCAGTPTGRESLEEQKTVRLLHATQYPDLPEIRIPNVTLLPVQHDVPRDQKAKPYIKNSKQCKKTPKEERDADFWAQCGIQPPVIDSNIYRGYDRENWNTMITNNARIEEHVTVLRGIIEEVNRQRAEWRELNRKANEQTK